MMVQRSAVEAFSMTTKMAAAIVERTVNNTIEIVLNERTLYSFSKRKANNCP